MIRVAVFGGAALRRNLQRARRGVALEFLAPLASGKKSSKDLRGFEAALVEISGGGGPSLAVLREALSGKPVGSLSLRCDAETLKRSARLGFDFHPDLLARGRPSGRGNSGLIEAARGVPRPPPGAGVWAISCARPPNAWPS